MSRPWRRSADETERVYGPWRYRAWGYGQKCLVVGCKTNDRRPGSMNMIECCHVENGGLSRKADWQERTVFGCWRHHDEMDNGPVTFEARHVLKVGDVVVEDLEHAARETFRQFNAWESGLAY